MLSVDLMGHLVLLGVSSWLGGRVLMAGVALTLGLVGALWWWRKGTAAQPRAA